MDSIKILPKEKTKYYTGVGSRNAPPEILNIINNIAFNLAKNGYVLRSGAADGCDSAFENGHDHAKVCQGKEIFLPWPKFNKHNSAYSRPSDKAILMASNIHQNWNYLSVGGRLLHGRNCHQVLGVDLNSPSKFVICWTKNGEPIGGTRTAIILAQNNDIPVYNLATISEKELYNKIDIYDYTI